MREIKKIDAISAGKVGGTFGFIMGSLIGGLYFMSGQGLGEILGVFIGMPVSIFIGYAIMAFVYNKIVPYVGGFKIHLDKDKQELS